MEVKTTRFQVSDSPSASLCRLKDDRFPWPLTGALSYRSSRSAARPQNAAQSPSTVRRRRSFTSASFN